MKRFAPSILCLSLVIGLVLSADPAAAGKVDKTVPFALDSWVELNAKEGPVTLHRLKVETVTGHVTKSELFRPGNTEFLETVRIVLDYSNDSRKHDWDAQIDVVWLDADGEVIDGYYDKESLNENEEHDRVTVTLSTFKYGLKRAKSLRIRIGFEP